MNLSFTVLGHPQPQGSAKAFIPKGWRRAIITSDNVKLKPWRQDVSGQALLAMGGASPTQEAVALRITFYFAKPVSTPKLVTQKITRPDLDKLARGALDSLTGIAFVDDAQVTMIQCSKRFGMPERAEIEMRTVPVKGRVALGSQPLVDECSQEHLAFEEELQVSGSPAGIY